MSRVRRARFNQKNFDGGVSQGLRYKTRKQLKEQYRRVQKEISDRVWAKATDGVLDKESQTEISQQNQKAQKAYHKAAKQRGYWGYLSTIAG